MNKALNETWMEKFGEIKDIDAIEKARLAYGPTFETARLGEGQRVMEVIGLYNAMLERMKSHLWFAEPSTIKFYPPIS